MTVRPLGSSYWSKMLNQAGRPILAIAPPPRGYDMLAEVERGDGSRGYLLHNRTTGIYVMWDGMALSSLPQGKVAAALADMPPGPGGEEVAAMLIKWRGHLTQAAAATMLGVSLKTYQGWEQGRAMPYPRLLALALLAFK